MKAAVLHAPGQPLKVEDVDVPKVGPDDILVKVAACGVCHTDYSFIKGVPTIKKPPIILGHEPSGVVEEVGERVTRFKKGDRVIIPPLFSCGQCYTCKIGRENICLNMTFVGSSIDGAFAEYVRVPAKDVARLPPELPLEESCIIADAISTPFHALKNRAQVKAGDSVVVYGCGGIGLNVIQVAAAMGAKVIAVDRKDEKLQLAKEIGAFELVNSLKEDPVKAVRRITGIGADVAVEAAGVPALLKQAFDSVRWGGRVVVIGYSPQDVSLSAGRIMFREIEIVGSLGCRPVDFPPLIEMVRMGRIKVKPLISHRLPLEQINEAFKLLEEGKVRGRAIVIP